MGSVDALSELLIAQLLEEDLRSMTDLREAERLQLTQTIADSSRSTGRIPKKVDPQSLVSDEDFALQLMAEEARLNGDAALAQSLQHSVDSTVIAGQQLAQKLAAAEKKIMLDAEFARRLQEADEIGDIDQMRDANSILGQAAVESILAADLNDKGKAKMQANGHGKHELDSIGEEPFWKRVKTENEDVKVSVHAEPYPICGICMEPFKATHSPIAASQSANSSSKLPFGLYLPCPKSHPYCAACLQSYIMTKLDPEDDGSGNPSMVVFPIRCPECPLSEWPNGLPDDVASRILPESAMGTWHHQKLLDSLPRHYCPNPRCSALVQLHDDPNEPQAQCPACQSFMCVPCRVVWHQGLSCEEYQALPLDERSPEDQQALQLIKAKNWRRCPNCTVIVELTMGCNHITCRCKTEFCFKCGSLWDTRRQKCTRTPSCDLWDEEMLLEEREREREQEAQAREAIQAPHAPAMNWPLPPAWRPAPHVPAVQFEERAPSFDWMHDEDVLSTRHWFTCAMVEDLGCGYCDAKLNSIADLKYHLANTRRHEVFACCGRFFKRDIDFEKHLESQPMRFGRHIHQIRRN